MPHNPGRAVHKDDARRSGGAPRCARADVPGAGESFPGGSYPVSNRPANYHFNPQWDSNDDLLARWMDKFNFLSYHSEDIHRELGRIMARHFTGLADTWYWSIPPVHKVAVEVSWTTLQEAMHKELTMA